MPKNPNHIKRKSQLQENLINAEIQNILKDNVGINEVPQQLYESISQQNITKIIKFSQNKQNHLTLFFYNLLKSIFQVKQNRLDRLETFYQVLDQDDIKIIINNDQACQLSGNMSGSKIKRLINQFISELEKNGLSVDSALQKYPIVRYALISFMNSVLSYQQNKNGVKPNKSQNSIDFHQVYQLLANKFLLEIVHADSCIKIIQTKTIIYVTQQLQENEMHFAYMVCFQVQNLHSSFSDSGISHTKSQQYCQQQSFYAAFNSQKSAKIINEQSKMVQQQNSQLQLFSKKLIIKEDVQEDFISSENSIQNKQSSDNLLTNRKQPQSVKLNINYFENSKTVRKDSKKHQTYFVQNYDQKTNMSKYKYLQSTLAVSHDDDEKNVQISNSKVTKLSQLVGLKTSTQQSIYQDSDQMSKTQYSFLDNSHSTVIMRDSNQNIFNKKGTEINSFSQTYGGLKFNAKNKGCKFSRANKMKSFQPIFEKQNQERASKLSTTKPNNKPTDQIQESPNFNFSKNKVCSQKVELKTFKKQQNKNCKQFIFKNPNKKSINFEDNVYSKHGYINNNISKEFTDSLLLNELQNPFNQNIKTLKKKARQQREVIKKKLQ